MTIVKFKNIPVQLAGTLVAKGSHLPALSFTTQSLEEQSLNHYQGQKLILWFVPSLDTGVCLMSTKKLNEQIKKHPGTHALIISMDLPFAQKRVCGLENLDHVTPVSCFRHPEMLEKLGVKIAEGPLKGLSARAVMVLDTHHNLTYLELVPEITQEPDYKSLVHHLEHPH